MNDQQSYVHKSIDQMETIWRGSYVRVRGELGVKAFGLGITNLPACFDRMPAHRHTFDGQEELYIPIAGSGEIEIGEQRIAIDQETAVRVGPGALRRLIAGPEGLSVLIAGGTPGKAYESFAPLEVGADEPDPAELPGIKAAAETESADDADYTVVKLAELGEAIGHNDGIEFYPVGRASGITSFGAAVIDMQDREGKSSYPPHDHEIDGQTEVYVVTRGAGELVFKGERLGVKAGEAVAVPTEVMRQWVATTDDLRLIAIGAPTGSPYVPRKR